MDPSLMEVVAAGIFAIALLHTFTAKLFERLADRSPSHEGLFHLLGEVEIVFGFWAMVLIVTMALLSGGAEAITYAESRHYTEPMFVFVVMVVAASKPIMQTVRNAVESTARVIPVPTQLGQTWLSLCLVPLFGSFITEPAAMTLAALLLAPLVFRPEVPEWVKYLALGVLFVNISIGGTLTSYAAPPVLMVASTWGWDTAFMLENFGWRSAVAVLINGTAVCLLLRKHMRPEGTVAEDLVNRIPLLVRLIHFAFLAGVVLFAHHPVIFVGLFLFFIGFTQAYSHYQSPLILKEALLVGFFLAGLVVLGGMQRWWLEPIVSGLDPTALFFGAAALTAITDNAALTYLGSLIPGMSDTAKYMLVSGAVAGGGLTVIANAPNPAGVALLRDGFRDGAIGVPELFFGALLPTIVAGTFYLI